MNCPKCGSGKTAVVKVWRGGNVIKRSRVCLVCRERFTTDQPPERLSSHRNGCRIKNFAISGEILMGEA
jgi:transcriptional regulator NrdR family protein